MSSMKSTNTEEKNKVERGTLYLVATPIGNLADLSARAVKVLSEVDFIAAEDTRNSRGMLTYLGITKELVSYFEHNKRERGEVILSRVAAGESCALITDAGTPAISDPGEDIVRLFAEAGVPVVSVPGPCAAVTALTLSALPTGRFAFEGFISTAKAERSERLEELSAETRTMIFYEAPHRLKETLADLQKHFGERKISLCRELTKLNEDVMRTTLSAAISYYDGHDPRGEYVLVVAGSEAKAPDAFWTGLSPAEHVGFYEKQGLARMDAIKSAAKDRGMSKSELYKELL